MRKFLLLIVFICVYFIIIVSVRNMAMEPYQSKIENIRIDNILIKHKASRIITVALESNLSNEYTARVPFGMNFFIGVIGLILIDASRKFYFIESAVQVVFGVIIASAFYYGVQGHPMALKIADMSSVYFLPLSSLFMVVLAFIEKKQRTTNQHEGNSLQAT